MTGIVVRQEGLAGRITLARAEALNALTPGMVREIDRALVLWSGDLNIRLIVVDAEGERAFCAGGDIAWVYRSATGGDFESSRRFWAEEYVINARIARFPKPVVALMQGYVMGGGVGIGGHASHRVIGHGTRIAMPECMIGLVPDVGASHLLAHAPGRLGEYLGLTGQRMEPGEALSAGFADHLVPEDAWPDLVADLLATGDVGLVAAAALPPPAAAFADNRAAMDAAFAADDLPAIRAALPETGWGGATAAALDRQSPLSMACALALIRAARAEPGVEAALRREFRFSWRSASEGELLEGIRAAVIDKDRAPRWRDTIASLDPGHVRAMLAPLGSDELDFPDLVPAPPPLPSGG